MGRGILLWLLGVPIPIIITHRSSLSLTPLRSLASLSIPQVVGEPMDHDF